MIKEFYTAWLVLTYNCNNRCIWCYANANSPKSCDTNIQSLEETIDLLADLKPKNLILMGGEPTVHPQLPEIIETIATKDFTRFGIVTNGRKLAREPYLDELITKGLQRITISIEGHNAEVHDTTTQIKGSFNETVHGLENCLRKGVKTVTNTTISSDNADRVEDIVDFLSQFPLELAAFNLCGPCLTNEGNSQKCLPAKEGAKVFQSLYLHARKQGLKVKLVTPAPLCFYDPHLRKEMIDKRISAGICGMHIGVNFVLDYNGDVLPCTHFTSFPLFNIHENGGVMSKERFIDIWNDNQSTPHQFRERIRFYPSTQCREKSCPSKCNGGCPLAWIQYNPAEMIKGIQQN